MKKNVILAQRLGEILSRLNRGDRLDLHQLAEDFGVDIRTIQRDLRERLGFLEWSEYGPHFYQLNRQKMGLLTVEDIQRFANFASIADLFPQLDKQFFQAKLTESIEVKGFQYESIHHLKKEFEQVQEAVKNRQFIVFEYTKSGQLQGKCYQLAPHCLTNKNGVWYVIGTENNRQKTFCFSQMKRLRVLPDTFEPNQQLLAEIKANDSISVGNQLSEVVLKVSAFAAPYFQRRALLPNQNIIHKIENGELVISCKNVNELDVVPIVQYWIPHLTITSPATLQVKMEESLRNYLARG